jgi:hypothetical protein
MGTKSTSPKGGKKGCLGKDGKYKPENCTGDLQNQGVGALVEQSTITIINTNTPRVIISN